MPGVCRFTTAAALFTDITRTVEVGGKVIISVMFFLPLVLSIILFACCS